LPARPSSSAMRARSVLICLRSSSILTWSELFCSRRSLFCSKSSSILFSSDSTNPFWLSALSESILSGGIPSLNHDAITWHRGTQRMLRARGQRDSGVSNYVYAYLAQPDQSPASRVSRLRASALLVQQSDPGAIWWSPRLPWGNGPAEGDLGR